MSSFIPLFLLTFPSLSLAPRKTPKSKSERQGERIEIKKDRDTRKRNSREIGEEKDIQDEKQRIEVKKKNNRYKFTQKKKK